MHKLSFTIGILDMVQIVLSQLLSTSIQVPSILEMENQSTVPVTVRFSWLYKNVEIVLSVVHNSTGPHLNRNKLNSHMQHNLTCCCHLSPHKQQNQVGDISMICQTFFLCLQRDFILLGSMNLASPPKTSIVLQNCTHTVFQLYAVRDM